MIVDSLNYHMCGQTAKTIVDYHEEFEQAQDGGQTEARFKYHRLSFDLGFTFWV